MITKRPGDPEYLKAEPADAGLTATENVDLAVTEDVEQIGKDVVVGYKQVDYRDEKNIISVIITAISVRINMPRGTVKALLACFLALLIIALIYARSVIHSEDDSFKEGADHQRGINSVCSAIEYGAYQVGYYSLSREVVLPSKELAISGGYSVTVPEGYYVESADLGGEWFANAQAFSFYNKTGDWYFVRTYITQADIDSKDLETIVLERLKDANDVRNIRYDYEDFEIGRVLACRYEIIAEGEPDVFAVEYSWADDDGTICSIEVSTEAGNYEETAKAVMDSVHRTNNAYSNDELIENDKTTWNEDWDDEEFDPDDPEAMGIDPYDAMTPDYDEIRKQEMMDSFVEYSDPPPEPDITDRVLKP